MKNLSYDQNQKLKEFLSNIVKYTKNKDEKNINQEKYNRYLLSIYFKSIEMNLMNNLNISKENIDIYNKSLDEEKFKELSKEKLIELINNNDFKVIKIIEQSFNNIYKKINSNEFVLNINSFEKIHENLVDILYGIYNYNDENIKSILNLLNNEKKINEEEKINNDLVLILKEKIIEDNNKIKLILDKLIINYLKLNLDDFRFYFFIDGNDFLYSNLKDYNLKKDKINLHIINLIDKLQNEIFNNANNDFFLMEEKIIKFFELQIYIKNFFYINKLNLLLEYKKITNIEDFINFIFLLFIFTNRNEFDTYLNINNFFEIIIERFEELYDEIYDEKNSYIIRNIINYLSIYSKKYNNNDNNDQINKFDKFNFDIEELNKNNIYFNVLEKLIDFEKIELSLEYLEIIPKGSNFKNNKEEIYNVLELIEEIIFNNLDKEEFINFFNDRKIDI